MQRSGRRSRLPLALLGAATLLLAPVFWRHAPVHAQAPEQNQVSVYSPQTSYSVPLLDLKGQPYIGLVELLEPLGAVDARPDGKKYKLRFTPPGGSPGEMQFTDGKDKAKVRGESYKLSANFLLQNGRGYVPLGAVTNLLAKFLGAQTQYHPAGRRLFIGTTPEHFTLELHQGNPSRLLGRLYFHCESHDCDRARARTPHVSARADRCLGAGQRGLQRSADHRRQLF